MRHARPCIVAVASIATLVAGAAAARPVDTDPARTRPPGDATAPVPAPPPAAPASTTPAGSDTPGAPAHGVPHVQRSPASLGAPAAVEPSARVLRQLARERDALGLVEASARLALGHATRRVAAMHAFVERMGQAAEFAAFSRAYHPSGEQITFREATEAALEHLAARPSGPVTADLPTLESDVRVATAAAQQTFDHLNAMRRAAETLATFLERSGRLGEYQAWAAEHPASIAARPAVLEDPAHAAAAWDQRALQRGWDRAQCAQAFAAPPAPEPGLAVAHGPYASSWWNSYADPYYDLVGTPSRPGGWPGGGAAPDPAPASAWETPGFGRRWEPTYPELGPGVVPAFGMFPTGAVGGQGFGPGATAR
jgi:hypothetical protein